MKKRLAGASAGIIAIIIVFALVSFLLTPFAKSYCADSVSDSKKQIALTFDDGPGKHTQQLLDGLRERGVKASFFLMGSKVEKRPEVVRQMHDDGHLIGCHTWSHISFFEHSMTEIHDEIDRTNSLIESITGEYPKFLRPPYGYYTGAMLNEISSIAVLWSASPRDWVNTDEEYIYNWFLENARDGDIILLHDTKEATVPAVLRAIDTLTERGFEFVRADELLCRNGDKLAPGLAYRFCPYNSRAWYI